ncbi:hypothetical protein pb186bvf_007895 [Paramecium bursaria]
MSILSSVAVHYFLSQLPFILVEFYITQLCKITLFHQL